MTKYLNQICIDTHNQLAGRITEITDSESKLPIEHVERVEIIIQPSEPIVATLTLLHISEPHETADGGIRSDVSREHAHCPDVDLAPLVAMVEQVNCGKYRLDGNSWDRMPDGTLIVMFKPVSTQ